MLTVIEGAMKEFGVLVHEPLWMLPFTTTELSVHLCLTFIVHKCSGLVYLF